MAFQLYEHEDMLGLAIDEHVLLRTLKVSSCSYNLSQNLIGNKTLKLDFTI